VTFGIDFDGTFAAAPALFALFVTFAARDGHQCVLVTQRTRDWGDEVERICGGVLPIVYAGGMTKREAARRHGWEVDVWIDDNPAAVDAALIYVGR
jgi:hypothetical protein